MFPLVAAVAFWVSLLRFYVSSRTDRQLEGRSLFCLSTFMRKTVILSSCGEGEQETSCKLGSVKPSLNLWAGLQSILGCAGTSSVSPACSLKQDLFWKMRLPALSNTLAVTSNCKLFPFYQAVPFFNTYLLNVTIFFKSFRFFSLFQLS